MATNLNRYHSLNDVTIPLQENSWLSFNPSYSGDIKIEPRLCSDEDDFVMLNRQ